MKKRNKRKSAESAPERSPLRWLLLAFAGLAILALVQQLWKVDLCEEGIEVPAKVKNITTNLTEDHDYGRSIQLYNIELGYTVENVPVSVIKTFNDAQAGRLFVEGAVIGDTVLVLVDGAEPKRYKLRSECE